MAEIILGIASSHGPMLGSPVDDFLKHAERDIANKAHIDLDGTELTYEALLAKADPAIADELLPDVVSARVAACLPGRYRASGGNDGGSKARCCRHHWG